MWLDTDRDLNGRQGLSVELLYSVDGERGIEQLQDRIRLLLASGVRVLVRVDLKPGQTIPEDGDFEAKWHYSRFFRRLAEHPEFGRVDGFIVGNEPNLGSENGGRQHGLPAEWYMKVHSGVHADPADDADAFTQLRDAGYSGDVLIAPVAPWSDDTDGDLEWYPTPPGATGTMHWLRYTATQYWFAFNRSRMSREDVKAAVHTYSNVLRCRDLGLDPALEPEFVDELRDPTWNMCQSGTRVYEELRQQIDVQAGGEPVPHYVTEWNSLVGRQTDELSDSAWPCNNYPRGLLRRVVDYMAAQESLLGFAMFVDKDPGGSTPFWVASAARGHLSVTPNLDDEQRHRLRRWDADVDEIFQVGW
jgi:hypothetical protein